jgi:fructose-bisphosphate aldolase class 1
VKCFNSVGFIAQSQESYSNEAEMFDLVHKMRVRIIPFVKVDKGLSESADGVQLMS